MAPTRTCIGCRTSRPAAELRRVVLVEGRLVEGRELPGRGAWVCPGPDCVALAARRRAFGRALRADIPPDAVAAFLQSWVG